MKIKAVLIGLSSGFSNVLDMNIPHFLINYWIGLGLDLSFKVLLRKKVMDQKIIIIDLIDLDI